MKPRMKLESPIIGIGPFKCPFCPGTFSVAEEPTPVLLHSMPYCTQFDKVQTVDDAVKFMRASHN